MEEELKSKLFSSSSSKSDKYTSCVKLAELYEKNGGMDKASYYYVRSTLYDDTRVYGIYKLIVHYCCEQQNKLAEHYFSLIKHVYETGNVHTEDKDTLDFYLPYYMIIVCQRTNNKDIIPIVTKRLFESKTKNVSAWYIRNLIFNIQFVLDLVDKNLLQSYVTFLVDSGYDIETVGSVKALENAGIKFKFPPRFSEEECKKSNKILFYTGFANPWWNYTYSITNALGGSETAVAYLSKCFPKQYEVYVTGEVNEETVDNVHYVHIRNVQELLNKYAFHTVVISRYVAFFEMFKFWTYQTYVWAHDTVLLPYGSNLSTNQIVEKWHSKITGVICLTEWHKELFTEYYPLIAKKIHIINNGIKDDLFNLTIPKIKNRFVYTSCSNRGLKRLLELWPDILENIPDAQLKLASYVPFPSNDEDSKMNEYIQKTPSIQHLGKLGSRELYELISSSEYWLYPTCWHETSCITALEMMRCGVICIYYPVAGLPYTMGGNGYSVKAGEEVETILKLSEYEKSKQIKAGKEYVNRCSWKDRYEIWHKLLFKDSKTYPIYIINLERRPDRRREMIAKLETQKISNYEFVNAVDGSNLEPTRELYNMFKGNDFNYRTGVIGCALSHVNLWKKLLNDSTHNFYVILEDDVEFTEDAKEKLDYCCRIFERDNMEYLFIGAQNIKTRNTDIAKLKIETIDMRKVYGQGTFGYIISKKAAQTIIEYIGVHNIQYAIDKPIFYYNIDTRILNESIVSSNVCTGSNNVDSDIQTNYSALDMTRFKKTKYVAFCDWWSEEYGGGKFDINNNYFVNLLRSHSGFDIEVVSPSDTPDVLFYSMFGNDHKKYKAGRKIFYAGEPYEPRVDADYNLTFAHDSEKNTRLPLWLCYVTSDLLEECKRRIDGTTVVPEERPNFCSFIASNPGPSGIRKELVDKISTYKSVACAGPYLNNIGFVLGRGTNASGKVEFNQLFKFSTAFENNKQFDGYCTEKILDVYKSQSIPIYWGNKYVTEDFDSRTFINVSDFLNYDDLVEYIRLIDSDRSRYSEYFKYPIFTEKWLNILTDPNSTFFKKLASNILGN